MRLRQELHRLSRVPAPPVADAGADGEHVHWRPPRDGVWRPLWYFGRGVLWATVPWLHGFRRSGRHNIPSSGGVLMVANHLADVDPPYLALACGDRPAQYVALSRHFTRRPLADLLFALGAFPIRPGADTRALRYAREQLERGRLVIIFPEGSPTGGPHMTEFRDGAGLLALTPGVTVIPAAIWGSHRVMRGRLPTGRGPVHVAVGPPIPVPTEGSRRQRASEVAQRARTAIQDLLTPLVEQHPDPPPPRSP